MIIIFFTFSLIIRGLIIFLSKDIANFDLNSYLIVGKYLYQGESIYPQIAINHYPYFPFFLYFQLLAYFLEKKFMFSSIVVLKSIINLFDLGNGFLVYQLTKKNLKKTIFYLFNPVSLLIFSFHGQFDSIPLFFLLSALYLLRKKNELPAIINYSLSVLAKPWPIFFLPIFVFSLKKKSSMIIPPFIFIFAMVVYNLFWPSGIIDIFYPIITYRSIFDIWGIGLIIKNFFFKNFSQTPIFLQKIFLFIFIIFLFNYSIYLAKNKKINLLKKFFCLLIFFYIFTTGFSIQYFSWLIPFLFIDNKSFKLLYCNLVIYCLLNYSLLIWQNAYVMNLLFVFSIFLWLLLFYFWISMSKRACCK